MKFDNYDVALITDEKQRLYFLGYRSTDGYLIITKDEKIFVIDERYYYAADKILKPKCVKVVCGFGYKTLEEVINGVGKRLGVDFSATDLKEAENLKRIGVTLVDIFDEIIKETAVKTEKEIEYIKKACSIAEKAWKETLFVLKEGVTEREVAAELEYNFKLFGAEGTSFETIIAFGENSAVPHHETGNRKLRFNDCVLMDFGCLYKGYCSDMTRTLFFGTPDKKFISAYTAVYSAHKKVAEFIKDGVTGKNADEVARNELTLRGYGEYFTHSLGHGIGVNIHEYPTLSKKSDWVLRENMAFTNEPGVYFNGAFGIRIEDSAHIENGVYKSFMKDDKSLLTIDTDGKIKKYKIKL